MAIVLSEESLGLRAIYHTVTGNPSDGKADETTIIGSLEQALGLPSSGSENVTDHLMHALVARFGPHESWATNIVDFENKMEIARKVALAAQAKKAATDHVNDKMNEKLNSFAHQFRQSKQQEIRNLAQRVKDRQVEIAADITLELSEQQMEIEFDMEEPLDEINAISSLF